MAKRQPASAINIAYAEISKPSTTIVRDSWHSFTSDEIINPGEEAWKVVLTQEYRPKRFNDILRFISKEEEEEFIKSVKNQQKLEQKFDEANFSNQNLSDYQSNYEEVVAYCHTLNDFVKRNITFEETDSESGQDILEFSKPHFRAVTNTLLKNLLGQKERISVIEEQYGLDKECIVRADKLFEDLLVEYIATKAKEDRKNFEKTFLEELDQVRKIKSNGTFLELIVSPHTEYLLGNDAAGTVFPIQNRTLTKALNDRHKDKFSDKRNYCYTLMYSLSTRHQNNETTRLHEMRHCIDNLFEQGTSELTCHLYTDDMQTTDSIATHGNSPRGQSFFSREESRFLLASQNNPIFRNAKKRYDKSRYEDIEVIKKNHENMFKKTLMIQASYDMFLDSNIDPSVKSFVHQLFPEAILHYAYSQLAR